jgi:hypothetical protein
MSPQKVAKRPISKTKYLSAKAGAIAGDHLKRQSFPRTRTSPINDRNAPWPISPNMTPNKKGKVTQANTDGLTSL